MKKREQFSWANEQSRVFLSRGYLKEGQEVEDRVWDIAQHAEKLLKIDGFAEKFYGYMSRGFTLSLVLFGLTMERNLGFPFHVSAHISMIILVLF